MQHELQIETANNEDAEAILKLQRLAYQSEAVLYHDTSLPPLLETLDEIRAACRNGVILKAVSDNIIVGSVRGGLCDDTCLIARLVVHPDFRNQGIGTRLMLAIEAAFAHVARYELFTGHKSSALRLYRRLGYLSFKTIPVHEHLNLVYLERHSQSNSGNELHAESTV